MPRANSNSEDNRRGRVAHNVSLERLVSARRQVVSVGHFERVVTVTAGVPTVVPVPAQSPPPPPPPYTPTQPYFEPPMAYPRSPPIYQCPSCIPMMRPYKLDTRPRLSHNVCQFARQRTVSRAFSTNQGHVVQHEYVVERQFTTMTVDPVVIPGYSQTALVPVVPNRAPGTRQNPTQRPL
ncbi:hypothetical protein V5O48_006766 [Marasmius crinis-equi]|uniref:LITAF domain-containing protein n=1 Tax=Marasmius crinis-equi TaxID=585013 RepID=A0ABR3FIL1_9AGAR